MPETTSTDRISELRRAVWRADAGAYLVEPRVVRRVIRELYGFARLSSKIPHTELQLVSSYDVKALTHPDELGLESFGGLPQYALLIALPEEQDLNGRPLQDLMQAMWRRLFHGMIDRSLADQHRAERLSRADVQARIADIGQVEFDEAHAVLRAELRLVEPESRVEAYTEFAAVFLELSRFAPDMVPIWFPSLEGRRHIEDVLIQDVSAQAVYDASRLYGAPEPDLTPEVQRDEVQLSSEREVWSRGQSVHPSRGRFQRLIRKRERSNQHGNTVAAGIAAVRAAEFAPSEVEKREARVAADADMQQLVERLRQALQFDAGESDDWQKSLMELLRNSTHGFWNSDKKLLYDLQKVCLDHERITYRVDLIKWIVSRGRRLLRRPLSNIREVMMAKHLASSASRLVYVRLSGNERSRLAALLHEAADLAEEQMRQRMRPALRQALIDVGFYTPPGCKFAAVDGDDGGDTGATSAGRLHSASVPEQVAFDKLTEEALDTIAERGYLTMGYLRDAISRNDLKLPDLTDPRDLIRGDHLLRADDRLDVALDGVYRRGEFYLRWLQVVSSLAFGTRTGRFATQFLFIPFGGAVVLVKGVEHLIDVVTGKGHDSSKSAALPGSTPSDGESVSDEATAGVEESERAADGDRSTAAAASDSSDASSTRDGASSAGTDVADREDSSDTTNAADGSSEVNSGPETVVSEREPTTTEFAAVPASVPQSLEEIISHQLPSIASIVLVGFLLMAVIHLPGFRGILFNLLQIVWRGIRKLVYDLPVAVLHFPPVQWVWKSRWFVRARRYFFTPFLLSWLFCRLIPWLAGRADDSLLSWWWVLSIGGLFSAAVNSRLGRDAQELTAEWLGNAWYDLRARVFLALYEWVIDGFKWMLNVVERFIYAVDEWLRFHSGETWVTLVVKACAGVVWSLLVFLIRIYVNLLIEPTLHPVKHFPVVTVAHKIFLPFILVLERALTQVLTPYLGVALATAITWFTILFLPGIFGFIVWELKENWRLYDSNRVPRLRPVAVGSHGETVLRLMKPGFHSGTLPKLFNRMRRLERKVVSFQRFSTRRALRERLHHVERDIRRFVDRDLLQLLRYCSVWNNCDITCGEVHTASNSIHLRLDCPTLHGLPLRLLFQEQSGWVVATIEDSGWLNHLSSEQLHSFETALLGFYRKAGVELVREQMERHLLGLHPYDICDEGLQIWPEGQFQKVVTVDLHRRHQVRPMPVSLAASCGLQPVARESVVFAQTEILWSEWQHVWATPESDNGSATAAPPLACMQSARLSLLPIGSGSAAGYVRRA
ncbi:MAG: hypothetical protein R3C19_00470 [Planctomycetaceae bacterium]